MLCVSPLNYGWEEICYVKQVLYSPLLQYFLGLLGVFFTICLFVSTWWSGAPRSLVRMWTYCTIPAIIIIIIIIKLVVKIIIILFWELESYWAWEKLGPQVLDSVAGSGVYCCDCSLNQCYNMAIHGVNYTINML